MQEVEACPTVHRTWANFFQDVQVRITAPRVTKANSVVGTSCVDQPHSKPRVTRAGHCVSALRAWGDAITSSCCLRLCTRVHHVNSTTCQQGRSLYTLAYQAHSVIGTSWQTGWRIRLVRISTRWSRRSQSTVAITAPLYIFNTSSLRPTYRGFSTSLYMPPLDYKGENTCATSYKGTSRLNQYNLVRGGGPLWQGMSFDCLEKILL